MDEKKFIEFQNRMEAMKAVIKINDPENFEALQKSDGFWAPEIRPAKYSEWVKKNYEINPHDDVSVIVYSLLMNKPIEQVKEMMTTDFENQPKKR